MFKRLNDTLTASWDDMYAYAKAYYEEKGDLNVPGLYKTEDGHSLGSWILTQRAIRKGLQRGLLSEERITKLDEIGVLWTVRERDRWATYYAAAEAYSGRFGHLCVPHAHVTPDGIKLGKWLATLKVQRKRGGRSRYLTEERIQALDGLGMIWDADSFQWEQKYLAAQACYRENGDLDVPSRYEAPDGTYLGCWIQVNRKNYKSGQLDENKVRPPPGGDRHGLGRRGESVGTAV